ncbi:MAG: AmmeMemoRadiSam system protein A [Clostridia bacterium]|nr:AmmeMemoRadiSam system protein A [Clostridia bacterium]
MGKIISSYVFPHPPIIVPEVGKGGELDALQTVNAANKAASDIYNEKPTTIIITTPHGACFADYIYIPIETNLQGDLSRFGATEVKLKYQNNVELVNRIVVNAKEKGIYSGDLEESLKKKYRVSGELDHGTLVPLYFVSKKLEGFKIVNISIASLPLRELYTFGKCIQKAVEESDERVVFIASGDLSHRLSDESSYGYHPRGKEFDDLFIHTVKNMEIENLLQIDEEFSQSAGECGLRSFVIMFGAVDGFDLKPEIYSYEGPFGIGYAVARIEVGERNESREVLKSLKKKDLKRIQEVRKMEDPYVKLARKALETYVKEDRVIDIPEGTPQEILKARAGTFVSIKKHGELRGCIGTIGPARKNIAEEIIYNAISSGTQDPRFFPIEPDELDDLVYSVDILKEAEPIESMEELDVDKFGVIVRSGRKSGLLLPNLEGIDSPDKQVSIALQKAGIRADENYEMERFEVVRHK